MESCFQGLSFIYLHLRPLNNLWGLYDPKTENMAGFLPVMEQFLHIELSAMPFIERSQWGLNFFFLHSWALSSFSGHYDQRTWKFYDEFHHFPVKYPPDIEHSRHKKTTVNFSLHHSYLNIERFVKTSNRQVSWISLTSRLCKHYLIQWTGHNVASCIGKQYCIGMQRISQFSWYSDAVRIFKVQLYISQKPIQVLDTKDTRGILGFKENMTRIQWYVDLIDCAFFSNLFGLTIPITFHNIAHSMKGFDALWKRGQWQMLVHCADCKYLWHTKNSSG